MKVTFFGTTTLLFDDGDDQLLIDAHMTRPSLVRYICGKGKTNKKLIEKTEEVFFKLARSCEKRGVNCLVQIPGTSIEI